MTHDTQARSGPLFLRPDTAKSTIRIFFVRSAPQDGVNGFCVGVGDKEGYVTGLRKLVRDRHERNKVQRLAPF